MILTGHGRAHAVEGRAGGQVGRVAAARVEVGGGDLAVAVVDGVLGPVGAGGLAARAAKEVAVAGGVLLDVLGFLGLSSVRGWSEKRRNSRVSRGSCSFLSTSTVKTGRDYSGV